MRRTPLPPVKPRAHRAMIHGMLARSHARIAPSVVREKLEERPHVGVVGLRLISYRPNNS